MRYNPSKEGLLRSQLLDQQPSGYGKLLLPDECHHHHLCPCQRSLWSFFKRFLAAYFFCLLILMTSFRSIYQLIVELHFLWMGTLPLSQASMRFLFVYPPTLSLNCPCFQIFPYDIFPIAFYSQIFYLLQFSQEIMLFLLLFS